MHGIRGPIRSQVRIKIINWIIDVTEEVGGELNGRGLIILSHHFITSETDFSLEVEHLDTRQIQFLGYLRY